MYRKQYAAVLSSRGLQSIPIAFRIAGPNEFRQLITIVRESTGIDLSTQEKLDSLSNEDINKLIQFEQHNSAFLYGIIFSSDMEDPFHVSDQEFQLKEHIEPDPDSNDTFMHWYAVMISMCALLYIFMVTWIPIPADNIRFADTVLGMVIGTLIQPIITSFFGGKNSWKSNARGDITDTLRTSSSRTKTSKRQAPEEAEMHDAPEDTPSN